MCRFLPVFSINDSTPSRWRCCGSWLCCQRTLQSLRSPPNSRCARLGGPPTRLRYNQLRTKQPSRAKPNTTTTTKRKKKKKKGILNHPFYKLILNHPFYKIILNHPFFFFRGLGYSLDFFDPQLFYVKVTYMLLIYENHA